MIGSPRVGGSHQNGGQIRGSSQTRGNIEDIAPNVGQIEGSSQKSGEIGGSSINECHFGDSTKTEGQIRGPFFPIYLSKKEVKDCLNSPYTTASPSKIQYCLPKTKPNSCYQNSWDQLQDKNVFQDCPIKCYVSTNEKTIFMDDLKTFFVPKNEKYCDEGVTQCKQSVGKL